MNDNVSPDKLVKGLRYRSIFYKTVYSIFSKYIPHKNELNIVFHCSRAITFNIPSRSDFKNFNRSNLPLIFLLAQALLRVTVKNSNRVFVRTNFLLSLRGARNFVANIDRRNSFRVSRFRLSLSPIFLRFIHVRPLKSHFLTQSRLSTTIWYILSKTGGTMLYALLRD